MDAKTLIESLSLLINIKRPVFIWGAPGVGKSAIVRQVAQSRNGHDLIDLRALLYDVVEFKGIPVEDEGYTKWLIPRLFPQGSESKGILFLDELNAAPPSVQAACYQLVLDRKIGDYKLPDGWAVLAAGNRESDRAVVHRMPSPLANRFVHVELEPDIESWTAWALKNSISTEIIAFLRFRPEKLFEFDTKKVNLKAFPTPRTWEYVHDILEQKPGNGIEFELIKGTVGEGAAAEFVGFLKVARQLPDPDAILMDPANADVPDDPSALYALSGALSRKASEQNFGRLVTYVNRLPQEFSVLTVRDAVGRDKKLAKTRAYIEWASDHSSVLI